MSSGRAPSWFLLLACAVAGAHGCRVERELGEGDTLHESGFADPESPEFHGIYLAAHGYPLGECRECHGDDYQGGNVRSSCATSGCHTEGVESCGTCHDAIPTSGAHAAHDVACDVCHEVPDDARSPHHPDGTIGLSFSGLATAADHHPAFDASSGTCSGVYCHGARDADWESEDPLSCTSCHAAPPENHDRFATPASDCAGCHAAEDAHVDGKLDIASLACATCHGQGPLGAPPGGLILDVDGPGVGAHARHLDPTLPGRIGRVAKCGDCHDVPENVADSGHLDGAAPADVRLRTDETYAPASGSCTVACHWSSEPGPAWGDASGAARACDACHGDPPLVTRTGTAHPPVPGGQAACASCHAFDPSTHVDGTVDFVW